jgi:DNA-directed RNA polymerase specialized sigma24 family protein
VCVVMVHAYGWGQTETAELLDISPSTVRTHIARALDRLHQALEVSHHAD